MCQHAKLGSSSLRRRKTKDDLRQRFFHCREVNIQNTETGLTVWVFLYESSSRVCRCLRIIRGVTGGVHRRSGRDGMSLRRENDMVLVLWWVRQLKAAKCTQRRSERAVKTGTDAGVSISQTS